MQLVACSRCRRHIRVSAGRCPFCDASADAGLVSRLLDHGSRLSRAAVFAGAAACATSSPQHVEGPPPPPPPDDTPADTTATASFAKPPPGDAAESAQAAGSIEGVARNGGTGATIANTPVVLEGNTVQLRVTTDSRGKFAFKDLPPGGYQVRFELYNGNPHQSPPMSYVEVKSGEIARVVLQTQPYVPDRGPCCKPYGAPPARRRVV